MKGRGAALVAVIVGVVLLAVLLLGGPASDTPLDPRSHEPDGTSALVTLLRELDANVDIESSQPGPDTDVALVLRDRFDEDGREELEGWVREGGVLVVSDPDSPLTPGAEGTVMGTSSGAGSEDFVAEHPAGHCDIEALEGLRAIALDGWEMAIPLYEVGLDDQSCFGDGGSAYVVASDEGDGTIVSLFGSSILVNEGLDDADNAPVAAALLAPREGTRVTVLDPATPVGDGDEGLIDLVPSGVKRGLVQLAVALLVYVAWRARRLGQPVDEPQPVKVAGSELVAAVGGLLERSRSPQHAADVLRGELRRDLTAHLGLPAGLPPDRFAQAVAARSGLDPGRVQAALGPGPVPDDQSLLAVVRLIDEIRKEVLDHVGT